MAARQGTSAWMLLPLLWLCAPAPAAAAPPGPSSRIATCRTVDCLRDAILRDKSAAPAPADCKPLDGQLDVADLEHDIKRDLGPICRLLVARRAAAQRATAPCLDRNAIMPDWDPSLDDQYSLELQNMLLSEAPLGRRKIKVPAASAGFNNSTIFGTYVFDRRFTSGGQRVSFATYFCIADGPYRYVPYYYILTINDEIADAQAVAKPVEVPVLRQAAKFKSEDDQRKFLYADLNGDRQKDVVVLRRRGMSKSYYPAVCLYAAKAADCTALVAAEPMVVDQTAPEFRLSSGKDGTLIVDVGGAYDKPIGEWRFRVTGGQLKTVAQPGGGAAPK